MSMFTKPPAPGDKPHHQLTETAFESPFGGPSYVYRGAMIDCLKGGHVCRLILDEHPLTGMTFGVAGTITPLVDPWFYEGRLLNHMRPMPKLPLQLSYREDLERRSRNP